MHSLMSAGFLMYIMNDFLPRYLMFDVFEIEWCFMIGAIVWWVYSAPQNIPCAIVFTLGNKVVLYWTGRITPTFVKAVMAFVSQGAVLYRFSAGEYEENIND